MQLDWNAFTPSASLVGGSGAALCFVAAMLAGMVLHDNVRVRAQAKVATATTSTDR